MKPLRLIENEAKVVLEVWFSLGLAALLSPDRGQKRYTLFPDRTQNDAEITLNSLQKIIGTIRCYPQKATRTSPSFPPKTHGNYLE